eukprot:4065466-Pyramimonas_sp.AAC.1
MNVLTQIKNQQKIAALEVRLERGRELVVLLPKLRQRREDPFYELTSHDVICVWCSLKGGLKIAPLGTTRLRTQREYLFPLLLSKLETDRQVVAPRVVFLAWLMPNYGEIVDCNLVRDQDTGKSRVRNARLVEATVAHLVPTDVLLCSAVLWRGYVRAYYSGNFVP